MKRIYQGIVNNSTESKIGKNASGNIWTRKERNRRQRTGGEREREKEIAEKEESFAIMEKALTTIRNYAIPYCIRYPSTK